MKKLILLTCLLAGCAALRGQEKYTKAGSVPTITERIVHLPEMPRPGMRSGENEKKDQQDVPKEALANYWDLPVDKVATVGNPLDNAITAHVYCYSSFPNVFDFVVPAHTSQEMLFTTNAAHMYETLCELRAYEVMNGTH